MRIYSISFLIFLILCMPLHSQSLESGRILISEFMAINDSTLADEDGNFTDWIELHNPGSTSVSLAGWYLTDNPGRLVKWAFPAMTMEKGSYLLVFASGKDHRDPGRELHTNFKLSGSGEYLALVESGGTTISHSYGPGFPAQRADISFGYYSSQMTFFAEPTPGFENILGSLVLSPVFSKQRSFCDAAFQLELSVADPTLSIYYSRDGSRPSKSKGTLYESPIQIQTTTPVSAVSVSSDNRISEVITHTYFFIDSILKQPADPTGYPPVWGNFKYVSPDPPADYEMDPEICEDPDYKDSFNDAFNILPSLSIVTDIGNLFSLSEDPLTGGIYIYTGNSAAGSAGTDWERQISAEYLDPGSNRQFQINCGLRLHGGNSRVPDNSQKHSFRLVFRSEFGPSKLNFNLFNSGGAVNEFNTLVLRAGYNFSLSHNNVEQRERSLLIRDPFAKNSQLAMGSPSPHSKFIHLYLNGLYWGIYTVSEKLNNDFMASYLVGAEDDFDVVKDHNGIVDGNLTAWSQTLEQAKAGLASDAAYMKIQGRNPNGTPNPAYADLLDVDNLIDYMMFNIYIGNNDWDHNNWIAARNRVNPAYGFRFFSWDAENSMTDKNVNMVGENNDNNPSMIYTKLRENEEFRVRFGDRVHKHFFNGGALTTEATINRFNTLANNLYHPIILETARWGDYRRDLHPRDNVAVLYTKNDHWLVEKQKMESDYLPDRTAIVLQQFRDAGLYPDLDAPVFSENSREIMQPIELEITATSGDIYYTVNGGDPREPGGALSGGSTTLYADPIRIEGDALVKARAKNGSNWSALTEAYFRYEVMSSIHREAAPAAGMEVACYPNPFSHTAHISYSIPEGGNVRITILGIDGRVLAILQDGYLPGGDHTATWNPGHPGEGMYFYRLRYNDHMVTGKLIHSRQ